MCSSETIQWRMWNFTWKSWHVVISAMLSLVLFGAGEKMLDSWNYKYYIINIILYYKYRYSESICLSYAIHFKFLMFTGGTILVLLLNIVFFSCYRQTSMTCCIILCSTRAWTVIVIERESSSVKLNWQQLQCLTCHGEISNSRIWEFQREMQGNLMVHSMTITSLKYSSILIELWSDRQTDRHRAAMCTALAWRHVGKIYIDV